MSSKAHIVYRRAVRRNLKPYFPNWIPGDPAKLMQEQELRTLNALIEGQEKERRRVATDLHDRLGGLMATVKLHFGALEKYISKEQKPVFEQANQLVDVSCAAIRKISHDLAEGEVATFGLLNAVRDLADSITATGGLHVQVYHQHMEERLSLPMERDLYKILQELLTNAIRHAAARTVSVQLIHHQQYFHLMVEDDGIGMAGRHADGLGIRSIRGRVQAHKGTMHIDSRPDHGTTITIDIPLERHGDD